MRSVSHILHHVKPPIWTICSRLSQALALDIGRLVAIHMNVREEMEEKMLSGMLVYMVRAWAASEDSISPDDACFLSSID